MSDHLYNYYGLVFKTIGLGEEGLTGRSAGTQVMQKFTARFKAFVTSLDAEKSNSMKVVYTAYKEAYDKLALFEGNNQPRIRIQVA